MNNRIKSYSKINSLYSIILEPKDSNDLLKADFCDSHIKCYQLINSTQNILLNGLYSAVSLFGKEIANYYKDFNKIKNELKSANDIKR